MFATTSDNYFRFTFQGPDFSGFLWPMRHSGWSSWAAILNGTTSTGRL